MQNAFQRFRVSGPSTRRRRRAVQRQPSSALTEVDVSNTPARPLTQSACQRCRRLKKKCTPTRQGACRLCLAAVLPCSFPKAVQDSREREKELQDRIMWLSQQINKTLPVDSVPVELVETGNQLPVAHASPETTIRNDPALEEPLDELYSVGESSAAFERQEFPDAKNPSPFLLGKSTGLRLVDAYFRHVHRAYPFLDRAEVLQDLDLSFKENKGSPVELEVCNLPTRLAVVMAIGRTTLQRASEFGEASLTQFNIPEKEIVHECLCKKDLVSVEILALLALYSLFEADSIPPGAITGILARKVISMGLAKDSIAISQVETERRRRLFWSVYVLDRMISVSYGLPATINDEEISVPLPSIAVQEYASPDRYYYAMALQVNRHVVSLRKLEWKILQMLHLAPAHQVNLLGQDVDNIRRQIEDWYTQGCLLSSSAIVDNDHIPFHNTITWHNVRYQNLILLLYSPSKLNFQRSVSRAVEVEAAAQKYVQSSMILFQQNHLPLNWITLCRFLTLGALFFHCHSYRVRRFRSQLSSTISQRNKEEADVRIATAVNLCAQILDLFPDTWQAAKRAAGILHQFSNYITSTDQHVRSTVPEAVSVSDIRTRHFGATSDQGSSPLGTLPYEGRSLSLYLIRSRFKELIQSTLGETSVYAHAVSEELSSNDLLQGTLGSDMFHHDTQGALSAADQLFPRPDISIGDDGLGMNNSRLDMIDEFGLGIF
jgi:Fungal specific transcription factor domain